MIVNFFHVTVPTERAEAFEASWSRRAGLVDAMPGFLGMEVLRDGATAGRYIVLTRWETREAFDAWVSSPQFFAGHAHTQTGGASDPAPGDLEFYEVIPSTPTGGEPHTHG